MKTIAERLEELNIELKEIAANVTKQMRMQWALDNNCSLVTVDRYLNGKAKMTVVAEKLLNDMKVLLNITEAA